MAMTKEEMKQAAVDLGPYTHSVGLLKDTVIAYFRRGRKKTFRAYKEVRKWMIHDLRRCPSMTVKQAAHFAGMSPSGIHYRIRQDDIPAMKHGGTIFIDTEGFLIWYENQTCRKPGRKPKKS